MSAQASFRPASRIKHSLAHPVLVGGPLAAFVCGSTATRAAGAETIGIPGSPRPLTSLASRRSLRDGTDAQCKQSKISDADPIYIRRVCSRR
jgi:hypothetical protein